MLTKLEVRTPAGDLFTLVLDDTSSGYTVKDIQGLDPVKATLTSSSFANLDGAQFQSARRESRNIVLTLGLDPDPSTDDTVRTLRTRLYKFFMTKSEVRLRFFDDDGLIVNIVGQVESCEAPLFAKEPAADISIVCFQPDLVASSSTTVTGGTVSTGTNELLTYDGTVDTGFILTLEVDRSLSEFTIYVQTSDGVLRSFDVQASLVSGDVVTISTLEGDKGATLTRAGVDTSLLYAVTPQSDWIQFQNGDNSYRVYTTGAAIPFSIEYVERYGGL